MYEFEKTWANFVFMVLFHSLGLAKLYCNIKFYYNCQEVRRRAGRQQRDSGSKFGAACFMFTGTSSDVTGCLLGGMNTDIKKLFCGFASYQTFLPNTAAKDNQETARAILRAQLNKYLDVISAITVPSNIFDFGKRKGVNSLLFLHSSLIRYVHLLLWLWWREFVVQAGVLL